MLVGIAVSDLDWKSTFWYKVGDDTEFKAVINNEDGLLKKQNFGINS